MAGYAPKRFSGREDKDIDEFIKDYRLYLTAANITTANAGGKQRALKLFWSYLTDETSRWVEDKLIGKKWRLNHVRCGNALANMATIVALNNANITATMINAPDGTLQWWVLDLSNWFFELDSFGLSKIVQNCSKLSKT